MFDKKSIKNQLAIILLVTFFNPSIPNIKKSVSRKCKAYTSFHEIWEKKTGFEKHICSVTFPFEIALLSPPVMGPI